jgi:hypothetical protein
MFISNEISAFVCLKIVHFYVYNFNCLHLKVKGGKNTMAIFETHFKKVPNPKLILVLPLLPSFTKTCRKLNWLKM